MKGTETQTERDGIRTSWRTRTIRRQLLLLAVLPLAGLGVALGYGLTRDSGEQPPAHLDQPAPAFDLPPVHGRELGLSSADLADEVALVNVWASWCYPCRREKPLFLRLKEEGVVPVHGLNYRDEPEQAADFLDRFGDAYTRTGADRSGRVAIDWGVYGLPKTYVVDHGRIVHRHVGEMTPQALERTILPLVRELQRRRP